MTGANFAVSAPGKTILYGEHAVVYGAPAIAASVALHTYVAVESLTTEVVELDFPAVKLTISFSLSELKQLAKVYETHADQLNYNLELANEANKLVLTKLPNTKPFQLAAAGTFVYLFVASGAASNLSLGVRLTTSSTLPVGAGLGSSASFSASLSAALLRLANKLSVKTEHETAMELVTAYSFLGEKYIHGTPSGIDNVVATRGGAVYFQRREGLPPLVKPYAKFPALDLLLTDTGVPRTTRELVERVAALKREWPLIFAPLLEAFKQIVNEADNLLSAEVQGPEFARKVCELAELNHGLLATLMVSHPAIERVRKITKELNLGATKLTGAGGGGCVITLREPNSGGEHASIDAFKTRLGDQYKVFATSLGIGGVAYAELPANTNVGSGTELSKLHWQYW